MPTKICTKCREDKDLSLYFQSNKYYCKACISEVNKGWQNKNKKRWQDYNAAFAKKQRAADPDRFRSYDRRKTLKKFGESLEWYEAKMQEQGGVCALCFSAKSHNHQSGRKASLAIDHDHETGKARGLLCMICNHALHKLDKDRKWAEHAIAYLHKYQQSKSVQD